MLQPPAPLLWLLLAHVGAARQQLSLEQWAFSTQPFLIPTKHFTLEGIARCASCYGGGLLFSLMVVVLLLLKLRAPLQMRY